jgi:hypothetical protein
MTLPRLPKRARRVRARAITTRRWQPVGKRIVELRREGLAGRRRRQQDRGREGDDERKDRRHQAHQAMGARRLWGLVVTGRRRPVAVLGADHLWTEQVGRPIRRAALPERGREQADGHVAQ